MLNHVSHVSISYGETNIPIKDLPIDKKNLFLLSGRAVSRCSHKTLQEKLVATDRQSNFQILITWENKLSKAELQKLKFAKKPKKQTNNNGVQLSFYIVKLSIFSCQLFCNSCSFLLLHFLL